MKKILIICKKRRIYSSNTSNTTSSGLINSAKFINDMLSKNEIESKLVDVIDNNCIDKEVSKFKPDIVIIEALWVVPEKFKILKKLHPNVKWIIRIHSETPFLANEGVAIDWIYKYLEQDNLYVGVNSKRILREFKKLKMPKIIYLPNYYPVDFTTNFYSGKCSNEINIGCFGAVRPMKNHLIQAISSIEFANKIGKVLNFHINVSRVEGRGEPVLKNIRNLFENNQPHKLIEYEWFTHDKFIELCSLIDIHLQVSLSETFNITAADFVNNNIPIVVSPEIKWASRIFHAKPNSSKSIFRKINLAWKLRKFQIHFLNKINLYFFCKKSEKIWLLLFK